MKFEIKTSRQVPIINYLRISVMKKESSENFFVLAEIRAARMKKIS